MRIVLPRPNPPPPLTYKQAFHIIIYNHPAAVTQTVLLKASEPHSTFALVSGFAVACLIMRETTLAARPASDDAGHFVSSHLAD
jgi:hypothetical protein